MHSQDNDNIILQRYVELANAVVVSAINDYCKLLIQRHFYPQDDEVRLVKEEVNGDPRKMKNVLSNHNKITMEGISAYHFLRDPKRVRWFTSFEPDDLLTFARRKAKMLIEEDDYEEIRKQFRVGFKRDSVWNRR